jgi:1,4-alpha-glucan branching enzyme
MSRVKRTKLKEDPHLIPYAAQLKQRADHINEVEKRLTQHTQSLDEFANAHEYFGLHQRNGNWIFREWAPNATAIYLIGDFTNWNLQETFALNYGDQPGVWEIELPLETIQHQDLYKLHIFWPGGDAERIPAYARRTVQDPQTHIFSAQVWHPPHPYQWQHPHPKKRIKNPLIYETHIGMAQEEPKIGTYTEFREHTLPRIIDAGYNTLQIMGIIEHPYYASFGYHISSFFAASSRFGTPEELKHLIDTCHQAGIAVIIDLVHSHAVKNEAEGLSRFDGTPYQYFHAGERGHHPAWDSRCFDYGKPEVLHFLLSNARYWIDEFNLDGFRFDGVTSMLYHHRGLGASFNDYSAYFDGSLDLDALAYLALANKLIHTIRPHALTIAEDVSGLPGLSAPEKEGGCGFDLRLAMGIPDIWFKLANDIPDEAWNLGWLYHELTTHRPEEHTLSYLESHDQALVGGKTFIFELIDKEMYFNMHASASNLTVDRGIALHKMARLLTLLTAHHGYLNFMGNEFGHPEWIDFPRQGNEWTHHYARRQWSLRDNPDLKFHQLATFDRAMLQHAHKAKIFHHEPQLLHIHEDNKIIVLQRGDLLCCFNFHPNHSQPDYALNVPPGTYTLLLNTDHPTYGGHDILQHTQPYTTTPAPDDTHQLHLYIPARTALILKRTT